MMEIAIVALIVTIAVGGLALRLVRQLRAPASGCGCDGCSVERCASRQKQPR